LTPRLNLFLLALILAVGLPFYWFQINAGRGDAAPKALTITELRKLADSIPGQKPTDVNYEQIGFRYIISNRLAAGTGLRPTRASVRAYELVVPGEGPITIDGGTTRAAAEQYNVRDYNRAAERRIDKANARASLSILLVDHPLHNGNTAFSMPHARLLPDMSDGKPRAVAPGVVVIPLPGLTVGSNMVYAHLENGREYLFTGDAAMIDSSWREMRPPARMVTSYLRPQERRQIVSWLMTINALARAAPHMTVISGHEPGMLHRVKHGFTD
jgi:hypothetical protein